MVVFEYDVSMTRKDAIWLSFGMAIGLLVISASVWAYKPPDAQLIYDNPCAEWLNKPQYRYWTMEDRAAEYMRCVEWHTKVREIYNGY